MDPVLLSGVMQVNYKKVFFFTFLHRGLFSLYVCEIGMKPRDLFAVLKYIFIELQAKKMYNFP